MNDRPDTVTSAIAGVFHGFRLGGVYRLQDGTCWQQTGQLQQHHRAVDPAASILALDDGQFLKVEGCDALVPVRQLHDVIQSQIKGSFKGWGGRSVYTLTNGQVWQQAKFLQKYAVKYMPEVLVYHDGTGHLMQVAGTLVRVRRLK